ncbi:MAG: tRNA 2-selenouridine(34) synthase MnmH [Ramlibacter sp.]|nr:tRNA 2-selenouridine(34) synthase MnmH [Ramlibacter sp.]
MTYPDSQPDVPLLSHPLQLEVLEFSTYALVIDARSPHEYEEDHLPTAVNLPVVDDEEYAEVGTKHKDDTHRAYLIGVEYSLLNIAKQIKPLIANYSKNDRMLVYCFRGGKRSKLWADNLRTIGFEVDVLPGGWKNYRRWVRASLETIPQHLSLRVLSGATGCGKTRLLHALGRAGQQVLDLEAIASHRGSLIGAIPGQSQPTQKYFDTLLLDTLRKFDPARPVWLEAESKKIGNLQLPDSLHNAMHRTTPLHVSAPMAERVRLWREDYSHFAADPLGMVEMLAPLKPLIGGEELACWRALAAEGRVDKLFERVMTKHYDPCYERSTKRSYKEAAAAPRIELSSLAPEQIAEIARGLASRFA